MPTINKTSSLDHRVGEVLRPKHLAIELSKLIAHPQRDASLEQYATEGDLAAFLILAIDQLDIIEGKTVVDVGSGNGILGIGCAILGASRTILIEADADVVDISRKNTAKVSEQYQTDIEVIKCKIGIDEAPKIANCEIVVMNPPWGFQTSRADRPLLEYGFSLQPDSMYVIHSAKSTHLEALGKPFGYDCEIVFESNFRLPAKYSHQSRKMGETEIRCWRFHKPNDAKLSELYE